MSRRVRRPHYVAVSFLGYPAVLILAYTISESWSYIGGVNRRKLLPRGTWLPMLLADCTLLALMASFFSRSWMAGLACVLVAAYGHMLGAAVMVWLRNGFFMPVAIRPYFVVGACASILTCLVLTIFSYVTGRAAEAAMWMSFAYICAIVVLGSMGVAGMVRDAKWMYCSPTLFPVFRFDPAAGTIRSANGPPAAFLAALAMFFSWGVAWATFATPSYIGAIVFCVAQVVTVVVIQELIARSQLEFERGMVVLSELGQRQGRPFLPQLVVAAGLREAWRKTTITAELEDGMESGDTSGMAPLAIARVGSDDGKGLSSSSIVLEGAEVSIAVRDIIGRVMRPPQLTVALLALEEAATESRTLLRGYPTGRVLEGPRALSSIVGRRPLFGGGFAVLARDFEGTADARQVFIALADAAIAADEADSAANLAMRAEAFVTYYVVQQAADCVAKEAAEWNLFLNWAAMDENMTRIPSDVGVLARLRQRPSYAEAFVWAVADKALVAQYVQLFDGDRLAIAERERKRQQDAVAAEAARRAAIAERERQRVIDEARVKQDWIDRLAAAERRCAVLQSDVETARSELAHALSDVASLRSGLASKDAEIAALRAEIRSGGEARNDADAQVRRLQRERDSLVRDVQAAEQAKEDAAATRERANVQHDQDVQDLGEMQSQFAAAVLRAEAAEAGVLEHERQIARLREASAAQDAARDASVADIQQRLDEACTRYDARLAEAQVAADAAQQRIAGLVAQLRDADTTRGEASRLQARVRELDGAVSDLSQQTRALEGQLREARREIGGHVERHTADVAAISRADADLAELRSELDAELEGRASDGAAAAERLQAVQTHAARESERVRADHEAEVERLREEIHAMQERPRAPRDVTLADVAGLQDALARERALAQEAASAAAQLRQQNTALQDQNAALQDQLRRNTAQGGEELSRVTRERDRQLAACREQLDAAVAARQRDAKDREDAVSSLRRDLAAATEQYNAAVVRTRELEAQLRTAGPSSAVAEAADLRRRVAQLQAELATAQSSSGEVTRLRSELAAAKSELARLAASARDVDNLCVRLAAAEDAAQKAKVARAASDATLKQALAHQKESVAHLEAAVEKTRRALAESEALRGEKHTLEDRMTALQRTCTDLEARAQRAEAKRGDASKDLTRQLTDEREISRSRKSQLDELQGRYDALQRNYQLLQSLQTVRVCCCCCFVLYMCACVCGGVLS